MCAVKYWILRNYALVLSRIGLIHTQNSYYNEPLCASIYCHVALHICNAPLPLVPKGLLAAVVVILVAVVVIVVVVVVVVVVAAAAVFVAAEMQLSTLL